MLRSVSRHKPDMDEHIAELERLPVVRFAEVQLSAGSGTKHVLRRCGVSERPACRMMIRMYVSIDHEADLQPSFAASSL